MKEIVIAFSTRTDAFRLSDALNKAGIACSIINTPHAISSSCGISVKTDAAYLNRVLSFLNLPICGRSLIGVYEANNRGGRVYFEKVRVKSGY